ncbi:MAG: cellulase family glycosylhydrolase [Pyrinomonadaceae bacterium]|nr:cellulase family glycosylhydrolase [Sphingobacteriaceae bacterium]
MRKSIVSLLLLLIFCTAYAQTKSKKHFVKVDGQNLIMPDGKKLFIKGINLGNWLNPEGYLLLLGKPANSYRTIDQAFKEMVGEAVTDQFWRDFQKHYVTREDIKYIRQTGMNTIRIPFHYKMLTNEPYMGYASKKHGYAVLDTLVKWCKQEGLYVILDMHDAPGGQTGINIDDSYGYPWLLTTESHKQQFCQMWKEIAQHYVNSPTVLAYDFLNEPIASRFFQRDTAMLNVQLEALFKRVTKVVREVDKNHIIMLSGSTWGNDYSIFKDWNYDDNLMFTCHRYHSDTTEAGIKDFLDYRTKFNRPFYMGETGHEPDEWIAGFTRLLERVNIGWTFWPYKKMGKPIVNKKPDTPWGTFSLWDTTSMLSIVTPKDWKVIQDFTESSRGTFENIRKNRPSQDSVKTILNGLIDNLKYKNCTINKGYIKALGMKP